jgi:predicted AlkP superfamily phosphohydrolase/phosphomutase
MPELVHPLSHQRYGFEEFLAQVEAVRTERRAMYQAELERLDKGVLAFVFDHTDRIQHAFWATRDPTHPRYDPREAQSYAAVIPEMYREMDACLGEAIRRTDKRTLLLAVSDHGFGSFRRQVHLNRWLIDQGFMRLKESQEREGGGLFQDVDWRHTKAYAVGFASVYLNRAGREGGGIVAQGDRSVAVLDEIAARLQTWVDPDHNQRVVRRVYAGRHIYAGGPLVAEAPDLVLGFQPGYRASWQTALGGAPVAQVEDNQSRWSGDHIFDPDCMPGILLSNIKWAEQPLQGIDIAPTVLSALGLPRPGGMTGRDLLARDGAG